MSLRSLFLACFLVTVVPACGSEDVKDPSGDEQAGQSVSTEITAAEGGEVVLGDAALDIPAGALSEDTTITVETSSPSGLPSASSLKGLVYDFGPDGTEFSEPALLTLPSVAEPAADEEAVIAWLDETNDTWQNLATTANADGSLSAEVMHFTRFVVRFNGTVTDDCSFAACGGDVTGTWTVSGVCAEAGDALLEECPDAVAEIDLALTGTATFNADGTRSSDLTTQATITYTLSATCLGTITGGMPPASCDALSMPADPAEEKGPTTCMGDPTVSCTCVESNPEKSELKTGTYVIDGSTMTSTDDADGSTSVLEFCVTGNDGRFQQNEGLAILTWIGAKQ